MNYEEAFEMEIGLKSKVFYPSHGAGEVVKEKKIEFGGEIKKYFEFEFINKRLTISTPIQNLDKLGIRPVKSYEEIIKKISVLKNKPIKKADVKDYNELMTKIEELDLLGQVDCFIEIIQYCNEEKRSRLEEGRLVPVSITKFIKSSISNLVGEMAVSKGISYEKAEKLFTEITGLETQ